MAEAGTAAETATAVDATGNPAFPEKTPSSERKCGVFSYSPNSRTVSLWGKLRLKSAFYE